MTILYQAVVENNLCQLLITSGQRHLWSDLPHDVFSFLLPSRFCPSDKFMRFAQRELGGTGDGLGRLIAILKWIHRNVDYVACVSGRLIASAFGSKVHLGTCWHDKAGSAATGRVP